MIRVTFDAPGRRPRACLALATLGLALMNGCAPGNSLDGARVEVRPPTGWTAVDKDRWPVPGTPIAAWEGPGGSSLVVYRTLPAPGGTPEQLMKALTTRLANMPELKVVEQGVAQVDGLRAGRVEFVAPGSGDRLAPTGMGQPYSPEGTTLVPTRRVYLAIPRPVDTLVFLWHAPDADAATLLKAVGETTASLKIGRGPAAISSY